MGMTMKLASGLSGLALLCTMASTHASPIDVTYTVSGSSGSWIYDFSVTNNLGGTNDIYLFGVQMTASGSGRNILGSPDNWDANAVTLLNTGTYGGTNTSYDNIWLDDNYPTPMHPIQPGQTLSGFQVEGSSLAPLASVSWFAFAINGTYTDPFCNIKCVAPFDNPGFQYDASAVVPVPAAAWLFGSALCFMNWVKRKQIA